jgi:hypothetical protein
LYFNFIVIIIIITWHCCKSQFFINSDTIKLSAVLAPLCSVQTRVQ